MRFSLPTSDSPAAQVFYGVLIIVLLVLTTVVRENHFSLSGIFDPKQKEEVTKTVPLTFSIMYNSPIVTEAKAYAIYDLSTKELIAGKNATTSYPLASMTKLMTAITASELSSSTSTVTIQPENIEDTYDLGLKKGQVWKLPELIKYMLVFSSNDAAREIAGSFGGRKVFVEHMNTVAHREGMTSLSFTNEDGTDEKDVYGGFGTPLDVAKLMALAYKKIPNLLDATTKSRANVKNNQGTVSGVPNTNQTVEALVGIAGSKTGFTDEAGGNLVIVFDVVLGRPVVIVVMGSSREGRFSDVKALYELSKKAVR